MKKYTVIANYMVKKTLEVEGTGDMMDPSNWGEITHEQDMDCNLYDVLSAEAIEYGEDPNE